MCWYKSKNWLIKATKQYVKFWDWLYNLYDKNILYVFWYESNSVLSFMMMNVLLDEIETIKYERQIFNFKLISEANILNYITYWFP